MSTEKQGVRGAGVEAQRAAIGKAGEVVGWNEVQGEEGIGSGKDLQSPGIDAARGEANRLVLSNVDHLSDLRQLAIIMAAAQEESWALVALDVDVNTMTAAGDVTTNVVATFAPSERRLISERTKEALAVKRSQGFVLGRPPEVSTGVEDDIISLRSEGMTYQEIATTLESRGVPSARGGLWSPSTIHRVIQRSLRSKSVGSDE